MKNNKIVGKLFLALLVVVFLSLNSFASEGIDPKDPMVRITAAPVDFDIPSILARVSQDVSKDTGIDEAMITYFWQTFDHIVYKGKENHSPVFVDLYVPGFFSDKEVERMLNAVADALVEHADIERKWLFIHTHFPLPEQVYINGQIMKWDTYRGKKIEATIK